MPYKSMANAMLASLCVAAAALLVKLVVSSMLKVGVYFSVLAEIVAGMLVFGVFLWMAEKQFLQNLLSKVAQEIIGEPKLYRHPLGKVLRCHGILPGHDIICISSTERGVSGGDPW